MPGWAFVPGWAWLGRECWKPWSRSRLLEVMTGRTTNKGTNLVDADTVAVLSTTKMTRWEELLHRFSCSQILLT